MTPNPVNETNIFKNLTHKLGQGVQGALKSKNEQKSRAFNSTLTRWEITLIVSIYLRSDSRCEQIA